MKRIIVCIILLCCMSLFLLSVTSLAATVYDEYDIENMSFEEEYISLVKEYLYADLGINWQWTCQDQVSAYAEVTPQYRGFLWVWYSKTSTKCKANVDVVMCKRWIGENEGGLWRFVFTPYYNDGTAISGYTRLLSEE